MQYSDPSPARMLSRLKPLLQASLERRPVRRFKRQMHLIQQKSTSIQALSILFSEKSTVMGLKAAST